MKIRRYIGKTIRETMQQIRTDHGTDALILSNREHEDGVEVLVAEDFGDLLQWSVPETDMSESHSVPSPLKKQPVQRKPVATIKSELANRGKAGQESVSKAVRMTPAITAVQPGPEILEMRRQLGEITRYMQSVSASPDQQADARNSIRLLQEELRQVRGMLEKSHDHNQEDKSMISLRQELRKIRALLTEASGSATAAATSSSTIPVMHRELQKIQDLMEQQSLNIAWSDLTERNPVQVRLLRQLMQMDLSPKLCKQLVAEMQEPTNVEHAWRHVLAKLAGKLPVQSEDMIGKGGLIALHGPAGVGKTTTIAKLAARFVVNNGARSVALITMDNHRIGAHAQLRSYAGLLGIPMHVATDAGELQDRIHDLAGRKLVLIDTAGYSRQDPRLDEQLQMFKTAVPEIRHYLVISCTTSGITLNDIITRYRPLGLAGTILTRLDEAGTLGSMLSLLIKHELPVAYICDGQRVPEDIFAARAYQLVSRNVALMNKHYPEGELPHQVLKNDKAVSHA
jgi:flagellar biosynthesis protein FlhF